MPQEQSFADFELAGWEDAATAEEYDRNFSLVTTQSIDALLDDAAVGLMHLPPLTLWSMPSACATFRILMWR